jgi:uridine phosphorylase
MDVDSESNLVESLPSSNMDIAGKNKCEPEDDDEELVLKNPRIKRDEEDVLYHLALGNKTHNLVEMFGDVKVKR